MREIRDIELLEHYLEKHQIRSFFDTPDLPFRLYEYAPGEMLNVVHPMEESIKFIVEGVLDHYTILDDGSPYLIHRCDHFGFMGDMAFCGREPENRFQEVIERVLAVELPLEPLRSVLEKDCRFLHFMLDNMARHMVHSMYVRVYSSSAEAAIFGFIRWRCSDRTLTNVAEAAHCLNFSPRQIQRALKNLTDQGILRKEGRGCYRLLSDTFPL